MKQSQSRKNEVQLPYYQDDQLFWYGCNLVEIVNQYKTPVHVGSSEAVSDSIQTFQYDFEDCVIPFKIFYSVKTNPVPVFLDQLHRNGCGFEAISPYESDLIRRLGIPSDKVIQTGVYAETVSDLPTGLKMITVSSLNQLEQLLNISEKEQSVLPVGITIRPGLFQAYWDLTLNTSRKKSPVGVSPQSEEFNEMLNVINTNRGLKLAGLHMHLGSGIRSAKPFIKGIQALEKSAIKAAKYGMKITILDIGGGYGLSTAPMLKVRNIIRSLLGFPKPENGAEQSSFMFTSIVKQLNNTIRNLKSHNIIIEDLIAEPGRILSGPCQLMILTVKEVVTNRKNTNYLICDAGAMSLSPMLITERHKIMALEMKHNKTVKYEILGKLPSALDRVSTATILPEMEPGDHIAVLDTGAYIISMNNTFRGPRPPVVWIENEKPVLARRRETIEDMMTMELLPQNFSMKHQHDIH